MAEETAVRVNFGRPMPVFPLGAVSLMPHSVLPIHVFEERYKQMVTDALDGPGQIAMGVFAGDAWQNDYNGRPPLRPAMCIGQIVQHHRLPDGRYNVALCGVCRARIVEELPPDEDRMYRTALLEPIGIEPVDEGSLTGARRSMTRLLEAGPLSDLRDASTVLRHLADEDVPTSAILELVTFALLTEPELRYNLLAEPDVQNRVELIEGELDRLRRLLQRAAPQRALEAPKGCTWN